MAVDVKRGLVFAPTGSAADDFYGADRAGDNLFANTLLALDANTGKRVWHFQAVKHDIWDRDFPSPPSLVGSDGAASGSMPWLRQRKRVMFTCSSGPPVHLYSLSCIGSTRQATCPVRWRPGPSLCPPSPRRSPGRL
jgi:quinoprotein glucose dehydrogenase